MVNEAEVRYVSVKMRRRIKMAGNQEIQMAMDDRVQVLDKWSPSLCFVLLL